MNFRVGKRLFLVAAVVGALALFAAAFFVALTVRSAVADPGGSVPSPGHAWTELQGHGDDGDACYVSTESAQAFEIRVNGERALRLEPNATSPNLIGGLSGNWVEGGVYGATIGGGGQGVVNLNRVTDLFGFVGGGGHNLAGSDDATIDNAASATVCGGFNNEASSDRATVCGGWTNVVTGARSVIAGGSTNTASGLESTVCGGKSNEASDDHATIGGGQANEASDDHATIGGGQANEASGPKSTVSGGHSNVASNQRATVGGGYDNTASGVESTVGGGYTNTADGWAATVGGGWENSANAQSSTVAGGNNNIASNLRSTVGGGAFNEASSQYATVPGGGFCTAQGDYSFAAGRRAKANHDGAFVWADSTNADFTSTTADQFLIRASGGVGIGTDSPTAQLHVSSDTNSAVYGHSDVVYGHGVIGEADDLGYGVWGKASVSHGVYGQAFSDWAAGVYGKSTGTEGKGVWGESASGWAGFFQGMVYLSGNVGIGMQSPAYKLDAVGDRIRLRNSEAVDAKEVMLRTDGGALDLQGNNADLIIRSDPDDVFIQPFGGNVGIGTNTPGALLDVDGEGRFDVVQITGGSDIAEPFDIRGTDVIEPGMVLTIDPENPGELKVSEQAYDRLVAGIISGAGGMEPGLIMAQSGSVADGEYPVALTGRVYCWADASNGPIEPGDLLTTSDTPGHAMKVTDYGRAQGAVIGKAMSSLEEGQGLVLALVSLQ